MPEILHTDNRQLWLLIALCLALILTVEAVEEAVEGAWPHQRRPARILPSGRNVHLLWGVIALLILPGILLAILNVGMMAWKHVDEPQTLALGGLFLAVGWLIFLLGSIDRLRLRNFVAEVGAAGTIALALVLVVADVLLLVAFLEIRPSLETIKDALPFI
ncbi:MAG TPA: hypothetical protein VFL82_03820 [Thermomicrobiales bacterium]|nr:hypothetical protein [Thermomicrobiales bacterium]